MMLLVRWFVEQAVWWAPLAGIIGLGVAWALEVAPMSRHDRRVVALALCGLVALPVADLSGQVPGPTVVCRFDQAPACSEIAGAERAGHQDVGAGSLLSGADDRAAPQRGSGRVEVAPSSVSADGGRHDPGRRVVMVETSSAVRGVSRTHPSAGALSPSDPHAPAEASYGALP